MTLADYWRVLRHSWVMIAVLPLIGLVLAGAWSFHQTPLYTSTASVYFSLSYGDSAVDLSQGSSYTQAQMESYASLTKSPMVLNRVVEELPFEATTRDLAGKIATSVAAGTVIIDIHATDPSGEHASVIANKVADSLRVSARQLSPKNAQGGPTVDVTTIGEAVVPSQPASPATKRNLAAGLLMGLLLGCVVAVLRDKLDARVRTVADVTDVVEGSFLGEVAVGGRFAKTGLVVRDFPSSSTAEAFRRLRTNLRFLQADMRPMSVVVTSAVSGEGKSTTALNLAFACAQMGERVLLVDADMRRPAVSDYLGLEGDAGLSTLLSGMAEFDQLVQPIGDDGRLDVLPAGVPPPNPSELLGSRAMDELLKRLTSSYDLVILDSPPLLPVTDAAVTAKKVSGAVVVAGATKVTRHELVEAVQALEQIEARLLGVVLSRASLRGPSALSYGDKRSSQRPGARLRRHPPSRHRATSPAHDDVGSNRRALQEEAS